MFLSLNYITWNPDPVIFELGNLSIRWYSLLLVISFYISYRFMINICKREGKSPDILISYGLFILAGLFIGGRLVHCLFYEPDYYLRYPWDIIRPWRGKLGLNAVFVGYQGMSGHGSAIGIVIAIVLNSLRTGTSMVWMIDRIALFGPLIGSFTRVGNLFNSEILGKYSEVPWAFQFLRAGNIPRHPVQLYEAIIYAIIFVLSYNFYKKRAGKEKPFAILGFVLVLVYSARFFLEFFKAKQSAIEVDLALNMGHLLSIPFVITGLYLLFRKEKKQLPKQLV